jgi:type VI secretion system protein ImpM
MEAYLTAPIWRFVLLPGIINHQAWTGLIMPSVDKVGRYFPLTVAIPIDDCANLLSNMASIGEWHKLIEQVMLSTLDTNFSHEQFDANLSNHPLPNLLTSEDTIPGLGTTLDFLAEPWNSYHTDLSSWEELRDLCYKSGQLYLKGKLQDVSLWWTSMTLQNNIECCWFRGMPPQEAFTKFLQKVLVINY